MEPLNTENKEHQPNIYNTNVYFYPNKDIVGIINWKVKLLSVLEEVPHDADMIKPLVQFIVEAVNPAKIYLMKLPFVGDAQENNHIDLMIVMPPGYPKKAFKELQPILDLSYIKGYNVTCSLHRQETILDGLKYGHILYSLQCVPENLIYDDKVLAYPATSPAIIAELKQKSLSLFEKNFARALDFRVAATTLYEEEFSPLAVFMLQQAVELAFRAIILAIGGYEKQSHKITKLKKHVRRCAPQLSDIFPEDTDKNRLLLDEFDCSYNLARYHDAYTVSQETLERIIDKVILVLRTAQKIAHTVLGEEQA